MPVFDRSNNGCRSIPVACNSRPRFPRLRRNRSFRQHNCTPVVRGPHCAWAPQPGFCAPHPVLQPHVTHNSNVHCPQPTIVHPHVVPMNPQSSSPCGPTSHFSHNEMVEHLGLPKGPGLDRLKSDMSRRSGGSAEVKDGVLTIKGKISDLKSLQLGLSFNDNSYGTDYAKIPIQSNPHNRITGENGKAHKVDISYGPNGEATIKIRVDKPGGNVKKARVTIGGNCYLLDPSDFKGSTGDERGVLSTPPNTNVGPAQLPSERGVLSQPPSPQVAPAAGPLSQNPDYRGTQSIPPSENVGPAVTAPDLNGTLSTPPSNGVGPANGPASPQNNPAGSAPDYRGTLSIPPSERVGPAVIGQGLDGTTSIPPSTTVGPASGPDSPGLTSVAPDANPSTAASNTPPASISADANPTPQGNVSQPPLSVAPKAEPAKLNVDNERATSDAVGPAIDSANGPDSDSPDSVAPSAEPVTVDSNDPQPSMSANADVASQDDPNQPPQSITPAADPAELNAVNEGATSDSVSPAVDSANGPDSTSPDSVAPSANPTAIDSNNPQPSISANADTTTQENLNQAPQSVAPSAGPATTGTNAPDQSLAGQATAADEELQDEIPLAVLPDAQPAELSIDLDNPAPLSSTAPDADSADVANETSGVTSDSPESSVDTASPKLEEEIEVDAGEQDDLNAPPIPPDYEPSTTLTSSIDSRLDSRLELTPMTVSLEDFALAARMEMGEGTEPGQAIEYTIDPEGEISASRSWTQDSSVTEDSRLSAALVDLPRTAPEIEARSPMYITASDERPASYVFAAYGADGSIGVTMIEDSPERMHEFVKLAYEKSREQGSMLESGNIEMAFGESFDITSADGREYPAYVASDGRVLVEKFRNIDQEGKTFGHEYTLVFDPSNSVEGVKDFETGGFTQSGNQIHRFDGFYNPESEVFEDTNF